MSDSNTGKIPDMSDAAKAFKSGYDAQVYDQAKVYDALVNAQTLAEYWEFLKVHGEKLATYEKAEAAYEADRLQFESARKSNAEATRHPDAYNAGFRAAQDMISADKSDDKIAAANAYKAGFADGIKAYGWMKD